MFTSFKDGSRNTNWGTENALNMEQINCGALLRIADAVEKMAENHQILMDERDRYRDWFKAEVRSRKSMARSIASLKGVITRMKRRAA